MQMARNSGMTLGEQIKANSAIAGLPLIMLTSTNQRDEIQRALKIGFAAYLVKPVKPSRLLDTIMTILRTQPKEEETEVRSQELQLKITKTTATFRFSTSRLLARRLPSN